MKQTGFCLIRLRDFFQASVSKTCTMWCSGGFEGLVCLGFPKSLQSHGVQTWIPILSVALPIGQEDHKTPISSVLRDLDQKNGFLAGAPAVGVEHRF